MPGFRLRLTQLAAALGFACVCDGGCGETRNWPTRSKVVQEQLAAAVERLGYPAPTCPRES